ncbi:hypothetical protein KKH39_04125 [Patescibacteria group bacterium]|nr:hypothetical protein [Patescibacteria group bacterium]
MAILRTAKVLYKDKLAFWLINVSILSILANWSLFLFRKVARDQLSVLHYNVYSGIDILGYWYWLYIIPGIFLVLALINIFLAVFLWTRFRILSYFLIFTIFICHSFLFFYLYNIL